MYKMEILWIISVNMVCLCGFFIEMWHVYRHPIQSDVSGSHDTSGPMSFKWKTLFETTTIIKQDLMLAFLSFPFSFIT